MKGRADRTFRHPSEALALAFLESKGHRLLRHNYHLRYVEIDLITATADGCIHLVEVKHWRDANMRHPLDTLDSRRRSNLQRAARTFLQELQGDAMTLDAYRNAASHGEGIDADEVPVSFDLVWLRTESDMEHFEALF